MDSLLPSDEFINKINAEFQEEESNFSTNSNSTKPCRKRKRLDDSNATPIDFSDFEHNFTEDISAPAVDSIEQYYTAGNTPQESNTPIKVECKRINQSVSNFSDSQSAMWNSRMQPLSILCKVFSARATLPRQTAPRTLAFELFSAQKILIPPGSYRSVGTDISMGIPQGYCAKIHPHFALASRGVVTIPGVIDCDFCGHIKLILHNINNGHSHQVDHGTPVAKLTIERLFMPQFNTPNTVSSYN